MSRVRVVALLSISSFGSVVVAACAPLLSFDLPEVSSLEGGTGPKDARPDGATSSDDAGLDALAVVADAGDLCRRADVKVDSWYCERVLEPSSASPSRLWECLDAGVVNVTDCPFGCFQGPPGTPDLCAFCDLGDGDYCPSEFSDVYRTYPIHDRYVIHCKDRLPAITPTTCDGGGRCVRAKPASHCP